MTETFVSHCVDWIYGRRNQNEALVQLCNLCQKMVSNYGTQAQTFDCCFIVRISTMIGSLLTTWGGRKCKSKSCKWKMYLVNVYRVSYFSLLGFGCRRWVKVRWCACAKVSRLQGEGQVKTRENKIRWGKHAKNHAY